MWRVGRWCDAQNFVIIYSVSSESADLGLISKSFLAPSSAMTRAKIVYKVDYTCLLLMISNKP